MSEHEPQGQAQGETGPTGSQEPIEHPYIEYLDSRRREQHFAMHSPYIALGRVSRLSEILSFD